MPTVQDEFDALSADLQAHPEKTQGLTASYQFRIEGDGGGDWYLKIVDGRPEISSGTLENPDTTTTMESGDFLDMASGRLSGADAFMQGKLKVSGDQIKGMRLAQIMQREEPGGDDDW